MKTDFKKLVKDNSIWAIFIVIFIGASLLSRSFLTFSNLTSVLMTESIIGILAVGIMWCILSKGIDLSAGSLVALSSVMVASLAQTAGYSSAMYKGLDIPVGLAVLVAVGLAAIVGLINGLIIAYTKIPPFIATLGSQLIARAAAQLYTNAYPIPELKKNLKFLGQGTVLGFPIIIVIFVIFAVISGFMLTQTRFGENVYAIGGNDTAARVAGINVEKNLVMVYLWSGICAGVGGVLLAARSGAGNSSAGLNYELDAIAAATVGGTSHTGGVAKISGVIAGILILGVVKNIMVLVGVNAYWQQIVKGLIIIVSVVLDMRKNVGKD